MPPSQLKIMFKLSDYTAVNFIELTSDMLEYNGKLKLEKYPIFDPTVEFSSALKKKILDMTYDKKIEIFFNTQTYNRKILNALDNKEEEPNTNQKTKKETAEEMINEERNKTDASFEFIIQCIFCTGLPLSNYYKTMEYYDMEATKNKVIATRSASVFDFINPTPVKKCFSYIKVNSKKYTVTGLTWINDVLNHPVYMDIIMKYNKYEIERKKVDPSKNNTELNTKLNFFILDIYDLDIYKVSDKISSTDSSKYVYLLEMRQNFQTLFGNIKNLKKNRLPELLQLKSDDPKLDAMKKSFPKFKSEYDKKRIDGRVELKDHRLRELLLKYTETIQNSQDASLSDLKDIIDSFNNSPEIKEFKTRIETFVMNNKDEGFENFIRSASYSSSLINYIRAFKRLFLKKEMYEIILNDLAYKDKNANEIKEMDTLIEKEVKNYYDYKQSFKKIVEDRTISNFYWKKEADIMNGESGVIENDKVKQDSLFEIIMKCNKNNKSCQHNKAVSYLQIGLEQINKADKTSFTYEAYINLEVAEGVYDESNYKKLMCPYISNVLGDSYDEMIKKEGKNNVMRNKVFVASIPENNPKINNKNVRVINKKNNKQKGGTKKRKKPCFRKTR